MLIAAGYGSVRPCPRRGRCTLQVFHLSSNASTSGDDCSYPSSQKHSGAPCFPTKSMWGKTWSKSNSPSTYPGMEGGRARAGQGPASSQRSQAPAFPSSAPRLCFSWLPRRSPRRGVGWSRAAPARPLHADPLPAGTATGPGAAPDHPCFSDHHQAGVLCLKETVSPYHANHFFIIYVTSRYANVIMPLN